MKKQLIIITILLFVACQHHAQGNAIRNILAGGSQTTTQQTLFNCYDVFNAFRQLKETASKKPELDDDGNPVWKSKVSFAGEIQDVTTASGRNTQLFVRFILSNNQSTEQTAKLFKQFKDILYQCKPVNWSEYEFENSIYKISHYSTGEVSILARPNTISIDFVYSLLYNKTVDEVPITCPDLLRVFDAFKDGSIRGAQQDSSESYLRFNTTINFENQIWSRVSYKINDGSYYGQYILLETRSDEEAQKKYAELKQQIKNCVPSDWIVKEDVYGSDTDKRQNYHLSEKADRSAGKYLRIDEYYVSNKYTVTLQFEFKK